MTQALGRLPPMARRMRGGPLMMLALLVGGWSAARVWWWDNASAAAAMFAGFEAASAPRAPPHRARSDAFADAQAAASAAAAFPAALPVPAAAVRPVTAYQIVTVPRAPVQRRAGMPSGGPVGRLPRSASPAIALAGPAMPATSNPPAAALPAAVAAPATPVPAALALAPALPGPVAPAPRRAAGRWSLDGWAFWRQGSGAVPVSQGRVPIYGASQAGAVLQYRLAPAARRDPRLYARAYRALVNRGENELAIGASLRPLPRLPVRLSGEVRYTDAAFFSTFRPAAYAVTEIAPLRLPLATSLEIYAQGGWVGGPGETPFADGQASLTRELPFAARLTDDRLRLSLGAGAWGGAQRDASRVDIGPTLRLDTRIGTVPARVSVDWREQVAGDAAPRSGVAATVSAGF